MQETQGTFGGVLVALIVVAAFMYYTGIWDKLKSKFGKKD